MRKKLSLREGIADNVEKFILIEREIIEFFEEEFVTCFVLIASLQKGGISCLEGKL